VVTGVGAGASGGVRRAEGGVRRAACGVGSGQNPESSVQSAEAVQNPEPRGRVGVMGERALARLSSGRGCGLRVVGGKLFADSRASGGR
jgi:hypothetical protein